MNDKRLLIAGCGDLGIGLAQRLVPEGWEVWGMRRSADKLPAPLKPWSGDLLDPHGRGERRDGQGNDGVRGRDRGAGEDSGKRARKRGKQDKEGGRKGKSFRQA